MKMATMVEAGATSADTPSNAVLSAVVASVLGWAFDLFDLFILLYVAPTVGKLFFPSEQSMLSLAAVYVAFAVTLLMRPFGSALFGSYADRYGRRGPMIVAVAGVGISTAAFGLLPTINDVGWIAPSLFLVLRVVQGLFVGGVVASTHTIGTESVPARWRGLMSGFVGGGGAAIGALLASLSFFVATCFFPGEAFAVWGWRVMFFSGILASLLALFAFNKLEESPMWVDLKARRGNATQTASPMQSLLSRRHRQALIPNLLITVGCGAGYYLTAGYLPTFLKLVVKDSGTTMPFVLIASSLVGLVSAMLAGHWSTLWGRRNTLLLFGLLRLVLLPVSFFGLARQSDGWMVITFSLILTVIGYAGYAPLLVMLNESFPTSIRSTGTAVSWNAGFAIGGLSQALVSILAGSPAELPTAMAVVSTVFSVVFFAGIFTMSEHGGEFDAN